MEFERKHKYYNQNSKIFTPEGGITDEKDLNRFIYSIKTQNTMNERMNNVLVLTNLPIAMLDKFANSRGLFSLIYILRDVYTRKDEKSQDLTDKILILLKRITINSKAPNYPELMKLINELKDYDEFNENLANKVFVLTVKWKIELEEWNSMPEVPSTSNNPPPINNVSNDGVIKNSNEEKKREKRRDREKIKSNSSESESNLKRRRSPDREERRSSDRERKNKKSDKYEKKRDYHKSDKGEKRSYRDRRRSEEKNKRRKIEKSDKSEKSESQKTKNVQWNVEENLIQTKYFRKFDEPNAPSLTAEEVDAIQKKIVAEYIENSNSFYSSDEIKHKESRMEGRSMKMKKESEKEIQEKLNSMKEKIVWLRPKKICLGDNNILAKGELSKEKSNHAQRINTKLSCFYAKESSIPDEPSSQNVLNKNSMNREPKRILLNETEAEKESFGNLIIETIEIIRKEEESILLNSSAPLPHSKKPKKGILKKSGKEEKDEKKLDSKKQVKQPDLDPKIIQNLIKLLENKDPSLDIKAELEKVTKELRSSGKNVQNILENIRLIKDFMNKSQQQQATFIPKNPLPPKSFIRKPHFNKNNKLDPSFLPPPLFPFSNPPPLLNLFDGHNPSLATNHFEGKEGGIPTSNPQNMPPGPPSLSLPPPPPPPNIMNNNIMIGLGRFGGGMGGMVRGGIPPNAINNNGMNNTLINNSSGLNNGNLNNGSAGRGVVGGPNPMFFEEKQRKDESNATLSLDNAISFIKKGKIGFKPQNYKTVPCRFFHSSVGCPRRDECHFIHDYNYVGIETPNMHKYVRPLSMLSHSQERNQRNMILYGGNGGNQEEYRNK